MPCPLASGTQARSLSRGDETSGYREVRGLNGRLEDPKDDVDDESMAVEIVKRSRSWKNLGNHVVSALILATSHGWAQWGKGWNGVGTDGSTAKRKKRDGRKANHTQGRATPIPYQFFLKKMEEVEQSPDTRRCVLLVVPNP